MDHNSLSVLVVALGATFVVLLYWRLILMILMTMVVGFFVFGVMEIALMLRG